MPSTSLFKLILVSVVCLGSAAGFVRPKTAPFVSPSTTKSQSTAFGNSIDPVFSSSTQLWANNDDNKNTNVNLLPEVDAATMTALGFGAIAFNFFVLANLGDAGIAGGLATIINTISQYDGSVLE